MRNAVLIAVGLLSWAVGAWHAQVFAEALASVPDPAGMASRNVAFIAYSVSLFLAPVAGWLLRRRAPYWLVLLIAVHPLLPMLASLRLRVV